MTADIRKEDFLNDVRNGGMRHKSIGGLKPYLKGPSPSRLYKAGEAQELIEAGVENRMRVKTSAYYENLIFGNGSVPTSRPLRKLVTASVDELNDLQGEADPSAQLAYTPIPGLLHKYELVLAYAAMTCSAHCRYCYRLDLFSGKTGKKVISATDAADYIRDYNAALGENDFRIQEVILSGGDPMILSNRKLAQWFSSLAEVGIRSIRVGTKELAFNPDRFDDDFFDMLTSFHRYYPGIEIYFMVHFTHPDEVLERDLTGEYVEDEMGYLWLEKPDQAIRRLREYSFVRLLNQTPIIRGVNDNEGTLSVLQKTLNQAGVDNYYFFQCRQIEGFKEFSLYLEDSYEIFQKSQMGLTGIEKRARFVMSTEWGKIEVTGLTTDRIVFKTHRASNPEETGQVFIAYRNPKAFWFTDYFDRMIDGDPRDLILEGHIIASTSSG